MEEALFQAAAREYERWCRQLGLPTEMQDELRQMESNPEKIGDCFYRQLAFGTGGLRGVLGAGTNRMNLYTVAKATQGLADYLKQLPGEHKAVALAHDSRHGGELFCRTAACVLAANGIAAWLYPRLQPTPALSFAVRDLHCDAGICVTASHNPAQYNGYKVYGADGCQITVDAAAAIQQAIDRVDVLDGAKSLDYDEAVATGLIRQIPEETLSRFIEAVYALRLPEGPAPAGLKVVYTPLNGAGRECVGRILEKIGVADVTVVPSQAEPDGDFPTCPYPNPEIRDALEEGIRLCRTVQPDLLLATDPDCDRVGVAVQAGEEYRLLSGNEMGVLLLDAICRSRLAADSLPTRPVAVTTIVSTDMADAVAQKYGLELRRTLTGFKFIGEQIGLLERAGEAGRFLFGFEESYGYLSGGHVRDKDAVNASMLICQVARACKAQGQTLGDAMDALYEEYGFYCNELLSFTFEGAAGMEAMTARMDALRTQPPAQLAGARVCEVRDYAPGLEGLPPSNVLELRLEDGGKLLVRPSGTEPKLKAYAFARGGSRQQAQAALQALTQAARELLH